jgi:hypothetical protein
MAARVFRTVLSSSVSRARVAQRAGLGEKFVLFSTSTGGGRLTETEFGLGFQRVPPELKRP